MKKSTREGLVIVMSIMASAVVALVLWMVVLRGSIRWLHENGYLEFLG